MSLTIGHVINGKYRVVRLIGDGGMGTVYEARHEALGSRVALKSLHPELVRAGFGERFLQEAQAAARIQSPHVVRVADVDRTEDGMPFMVLEYLEGRTLQALYQDMYRDGRRLGYADALDFAMQLFEGVEAAHQAGVIHRDLKPDNVMITGGARGTSVLKLLDFGIAKLEEPTGARKGLTRPGTMMGTPQYMAPEQVFTADAVDARADVFSLGVIIFEMIAGRRPVGGDEPQEIAVAYLTGAIARLSDLVPETAPELVGAIHKAMAVTPADRFTTAREFREAVEPFALAVRPPSLSVIGSQVMPFASSASQARLAAALPNAAASPSAAQLPEANPFRTKPVPATWFHTEGGAPPTPNTGAVPGPSPQGVANPMVPAGKPPELTKRSTPDAYPAVDGRVSVPIASAPVAPNTSGLRAPTASAYGAPPVNASGWPYGPTAVPLAGPALAVTPRSRLWLFVLLLFGLAVAVAAGVGGVLYYYSDDEPEQPRAKPPPRRPVPPKPAPRPPGTHPVPPAR